MKNIILLILLALGLAVQSQDITIMSQISKEVYIENVKFSLTLISFEDAEISPTDQINHLSNEKLLMKLTELGISHVNHELENCQIIPNMITSTFIIFSHDRERLKLLNMFLKQYSNCQHEIYSYDIINEKENLKKIFKAALNESKLKANKIAQQLDRNLGQLKNVKLLNENNGTNSLNFNLDTTIGWTAYPPSSSIRNDLVDDKKEISIFVSNVYEFTFETK